MMKLVKKTLLTGARGAQPQTKLCLVINFGDGLWVQHPVENELEAIALYNHYSTLNPDLRQLA